MNTIFIDLEFCRIDRKYKEELKVCKTEIIQIGAVKLNEKYEITERFDMLVKPDYSTINKRVSELTHITENDVAGADHFTQAMNKFLDWVGYEQVEIYSWSLEDKHQFVHESKLKQYSDERLDMLFENWIDFQLLFGKILEVSQQVSLSNALNGVGITFVGQEHSAVDDAENTARLFILTRDEENFKKQAQALLDLMIPTPDVTTQIGSLFTPEMLKKLSLE